MRRSCILQYVPVVVAAVAILVGCDAQVAPVAPTTRSDPRHTRPISTPADDQFQIDLAGAQVPAAAADPNTVAICFCVDVSTSMKNRIDGRRKSDISKQALRRAINLLDDYARKHPEKTILVSVVDFGAAAQFVQRMEPFNKEKLQNVVQTKLKTREGTAIGDAMVLAVRELVETGAGMRGIVVLTDGQNTRGVSPSSVMRAVRKNAVKPEAAISSINVWLVAFDVKASTYDPVKEAGATVVESTDQVSLENMMLMAVQRVLAEDPRNL
jgi:hypothetical protein